MCTLGGVGNNNIYMWDVGHSAYSPYSIILEPYNEFTTTKKNTKTAYD